MGDAASGNMVPISREQSRYLEPAPHALKLKSDRTDFGYERYRNWFRKSATGSSRRESRLDRTQLQVHGIRIWNCAVSSDTSGQSAIAGTAENVASADRSPTLS